MLESEAIIAWALGAHADPRVRTTPSTPRVVFDHKHFPTIVGLGTRAHARCRRNLACSKVGKKKRSMGVVLSHEFMWTWCWSFPLAVSAIIVAESFPSSSAGVFKPCVFVSVALTASFRRARSSVALQVAALSAISAAG